MTGPPDRLRVASADVWLAGGEIPEAVRAANATTEWRERRGLLLRLEDAEGRVGLGEASPLPRYSTDDLDAAAAALAAAPWERLDDAGGLDLTRPFPEAVAPALAADALEASPAARFAVETALLDLAGQAAGQPAWALWLPKHAPPARWPVAALLSAGLSPEELVPAGRAAVDAGFGTLKVKIGRPGAFDDELLALEALRMAVGDRVAIRLDANGTLLAGQAADRGRVLERRLGALAPLRPELLEEPVAVESLLLARSSPVPIGLDETLQRPDAERLLARALERGLCRAVVLKPMALGGAARCLALAAQARAGGAGVVASHLLDGPVAYAATATLALVLAAMGRGDDGGGVLAAGLGPHPGLAAWGGTSDGAPPLLHGAVLQPAALPGLGLEDRDDLVASLRDRRPSPPAVQGDDTPTRADVR